MKRFLSFLLCLALVLALPVSARADTGPKPSVNITVEGLDINGVTADMRLNAEKTYDFGWELISLGARILITIAVELAIALLFGFREKNQMAFLAAVNIVTQVLLNAFLNYVNYKSGQFAFVYWYALLEVAVFALEAILGSEWLPRHSERPLRCRKVVLYALTANAASFAAGLWLAQIIPGIF